MLATLTVGSRIPYRLIAGVPRWLVVTAVLGEGSYEVEFPDGHRETLADSR